ncbi:SMC-Scp complex subunit ScpB [Chitinophaga sancti]|uniref:SMC-Scp complex subunit ScpB n=1 Tax=Chitinophaga sancti TaxID=1004 RepID=UPI002A75F889|nr:SMC-Scp complex subunit ScpB [Chitinophaga sancti]WPQ63188.1 SMC-Scp complex subunit ScpB [Chitinophaga sancti]
MEISQIIPHVESLIFAADRPLPVLDITDLLNNALAFLEDRVTVDQVETAIEAIREKYSSEFYAFEVRESGGGFQFLTKKEYYQTVAQLNGDKFLKRLSTAALETLAIVAYKQPISKGEIEHIRGVSTDYSITKLLEKELIVISGRSETLPGKPLLYTTSKAFMDYFGLNSASDLPKLKEVFEEEGVQPTFMTGVGGGNGQEDDNLILSVSENGELVEDIFPVIEDEVSGQLELALGEVEEQTEERENTELALGEEEVEVEQPAAESEEAGEEEPAAGENEDKKEYPDNVIIETIHIEDVVYVPDPAEEELEEGEDEEEEDDFEEEEDTEDEDDEDDEDGEDEDEEDEEEDDDEDDDFDDEDEDDEENEDDEEEDDEEDEEDDEEEDDHPSHSK